MAIVNHAKREINAKIVYFGPEGAGKATSLRYVYGRIKPSLRGELKHLPSNASNLFFFEFSPFEQPVFSGYRLRLHLYTLQGHVSNPAAWKLTLKGADGVMVVGDAAAGKRAALEESILRLRELLSGYGLCLDELPVGLQLNKADLSGPINAEEVAASVGTGIGTACLTSASTGEGVLEALSSLSRMVIERLKDRVQIEPSDADRQNVHVEKDEAVSGVHHAAAEPAISPATEIGAPEQASCEVVVAERGISADGSSVTIPLQINCAGRKQEFVVTVTITTTEPSDGAVECEG